MKEVFQFLAIFGLFIHMLRIVFATIYAFFTNDIDMMGYALLSAFIFFIALLVLFLASMYIYCFVMLVYTPLSLIVMLIAEYVREFSNVIMRLRDKRKY